MAGGKDSSAVETIYRCTIDITMDGAVCYTVRKGS